MYHDGSKLGMNLKRMARILLVEDDPKALFVIETALESKQHIVDAVSEGSLALEHILYQPYDLAVLDWVLPDISGLDICRKYRAQGGTMPILFLTGQTDVPDRVSALDSGADDYLCKPFSTEELIVRVASLLRRPRGSESNTIRAGDIELEPDTGKVNVNGKEVALTSSEFSLLKIFLVNPGHIYSQEDLLLKFDSEDQPGAVKQLVMRLRKKIDGDRQKSYIATVRGSGYKFDEKSDDDSGANLDV